MNTNGAARIIFLTGLSGSGKSTVGRELARLLEEEFIDVDERVVARERRTIKEIFEVSGEESFRKIEAEVIRDIIAGSDRSVPSGAVVALGGGALLAPDAVKAVKAAGALIFLNVTCEVAAERLRLRKDRPLALNDSGERLSVAALTGRLADLLQARLAGYAEADHTVSVDSLSVERICQEICEYIAKDI